MTPRVQAVGMKLNLYKLRKKQGSVFVAEPLHLRFWRAVEKKTASECWEWMGCRHYKGYGEIALPNKKKSKAHRVAWVLVNGKIPKGSVVCHSCDNPPCCNPKHLFLGTHKTNKDDSVAKGRHAFGESSGMSKLTEAKVRHIRKLDAKGDRTRLSLASQFGISGRMVTSICRYENWKHVA